MAVKNHFASLKIRKEIGDKKGSPYVKKESLRYKRGRYGAPYYFLKFENGEGYSITNEEEFNRPDEELERELEE